MKYTSTSFDLSLYNKIFNSREGRDIVTMVLNDPNLIRSNHTFYKQKFRIDPAITPTNQEGEAVFISRMRQLEGGVMMDMRAPLGDSIPEDTKGIEYYSGVIPEFISKGTVEKATERDYKEKLFEQFGDAALIAAYAADVLQPKIDGAEQTLSHMAAQLLSTGKIVYKQGEGAQGGLLKAKVPTENFLTAGKAVWTDTSCRLLDQIRKIYTDVREKLNMDIPMQLEVTYDMFMNCFLKNEQVIEWIRYYKSLNNVLLPQNLEVTREMFTEAIGSFQDIPQIVIIEEKQKDVNNGIVHGWADNTAVLRPLGYAGYIRHTTTKDVELFTKYGNSANSYNFTPALGGLAIVRNSTIMNGDFREWHTDLVLPAVPSLDEFLYHYIINTAQADE